MELEKIAPAVTPPVPTTQEETQKIILRNMFKDASDHELRTLWYLSKEYGLDPIKAEIYIIRYGGKPSYLISKDGYLKIANNNPDFDGIEADAVYQGDKLIRREDRSIFIEYGESHMMFDKSKIIGAYCNVFRKGRSVAASAFVSWKDYAQKGPMWEKYPNAMIIKCAEIMAIQRAFVITGVGEKEEE